ncbi:MAG TPA: hypothetical protein VFL13_14795 [Candidatus Baltobacteraceae bacterium]|nr:hypothetical protein [Candidatus Baltobacteraceae bacterium]
MAISAILYFDANDTTPDILEAYDEIVTEMGLPEFPAPGSIYHWAAPEAGGLRVCDVWQSQEAFDNFMREKTIPMTARRGFKPPSVEITQVHETIAGNTTGTNGCGIFLEFDGDPGELKHQVDRVNELMNANENPPAGLYFHWSTTGPSSLRVYDHWRSREDFDRFVETRLSPVLQRAGLPQPRIEYFHVHNAIDNHANVRL